MGRLCTGGEGPISGLDRRRRRVYRFTLKMEELRNVGSYQWTQPHIPVDASLKL